MLLVRGKRREVFLAAVLLVPVALFVVIRERVSWLPTTLHLNATATQLSFVADKRVLRINMGNRSFQWSDVRNGKPLRLSVFPNDDTEDVYWSADGYTAADSDDGGNAGPGRVRVWETASWRLHTAWIIPDGWCCLQFAPDGKLVASGSGRNGNVRLWDAKTGGLLHTWLSHIDRVFTLAFSLDGRYLAATGRDGVVSAWDCRHHDLAWSLPAHTNPTAALLFSPDGTLLADVTDNVELRNARTGRLVRTIYPGVGNPHIVCFSPDSRVLATGGTASAVYLWDVSTGKLLRMLLGHTSTITALAYSADGAALASGSQDGTVKVWRIR